MLTTQIYLEDERERNSNCRCERNEKKREPRPRERRWHCLPRKIAFMAPRVRLSIKSLGVLRCPGIIVTFLRDVCVSSSNFTSHLQSVPMTALAIAGNIRAAITHSSFDALHPLRCAASSNYLLTNNRLPIDYISMKRGRNRARIAVNHV